MKDSLPIINSRKLRVAVAGCGRISSYHFEAILSFSEDLELIAVCDQNAELLHGISERYQVKGYQDLETLLKEQVPDLLVICTPSGLHAPLTELAARYAVNVVTEKPMATNWQDALSMVRCCEKENVRLFVIKQNRKNQTLQQLKQAIDQGRFGVLYHAACNVFWSRTQAYYDQAAWRGTFQYDGGAFMNQASHYVDLMQWLLGPVDSVQAMCATLARKIEAEDSGVVNLRWKSGMLGSLNVCMLAYPEDFEGSMTILGEKGTVRIGGVALNEIQHWQFESRHEMDEGIGAANYKTASVY
jgi:UDP-N-acetyl-2-amino-2-deoxyglucuronate dehydrogenase